MKPKRHLNGAPSFVFASNGDNSEARLGLGRAEIRLPEQAPSVSDVLFSLDYRGETSTASGTLRAKRIHNQSYTAVGGSIDVTGAMQGSYSLISEPYSPGVEYNRILIDPSQPGGGFYIDLHGLVFKGVYFSLSLWCKKGTDCVLYRTDGLRCGGRLNLVPRAEGSEVNGLCSVHQQLPT